MTRSDQRDFALYFFRRSSSASSIITLKRRRLCAARGAFREAVRRVYAGLGGHANFLVWAKANETEFYRIASRLIPGEMQEGNGGKHLTIIVNRGGGPVLDVPPMPIGGMGVERDG